MNFLKNIIDTDKLYLESIKQHQTAKLKKLLIIAMLLALPFTTFLAFKSLSKKAQATPFGLNNDYQAIIALNERVASTVPLPIENIATQQISGDKRVVALVLYFEKYKSPMASPSVAKAFVESADKNGFGDRWYLLPAISAIESSHGKLIPRKNNVMSYNAWGWGGPGGWVYFDSWENAAERISAGLAKGYGVQNLYPEKMMKSYCPPCYASGGAWAKHVNQYIGEIQGIYDSL